MAEQNETEIDETREDHGEPTPAPAPTGVVRLRPGHEPFRQVGRYTMPEHAVGDSLEVPIAVWRAIRCYHTDVYLAVDGKE